MNLPPTPPFALRRIAAYLVAAVIVLAGTPPLPSRAQAETEVDLALVLAVDVSRSMDDDEQRLQRDGFVEAFRSTVVHDAIRKGMLGRIAVVYMEWSGPAEQKVVIPWTLVDGPERAVKFAEHLAQAPIGRIFSTSISAAIDHGAEAPRRERRRAHPPRHRRVAQRPEQYGPGGHV